MEFKGVTYTDPGLKKKVNQDSCAVLIAKVNQENAFLAIVCDGVGGLKNGERASSTVVSTLVEWFETDFPLLFNKDEPILNIKNILSEKITGLNEVIKNYGKRNRIQMGTTIAMFLGFSDKGLLMNIGDSRIYCLRNNIVHKLSQDQTLAQREVEKGNLSAENALNDKRSHVLLQCIGASETVEPYFSVVNIEKNDCFLLCTDGFYRKTNDSEIIFNFSSTDFSESKAKQSLATIADIVKGRGEPDNIAAVMVQSV